MFWSSDQGLSFTDVSDGLDPYPNNAVQGLEANSQYLFAGLFRDAVWKRSLADFGISVPTGISENNSKDKIFLINSPNPFNSTTTITFSIPETENISIQITDVMGRVILEKNETSAAAGSHSFDFNGQKLSSGIYFAKLKVDDEVKVLKMILSR